MIKSHKPLPGLLLSLALIFSLSITAISQSQPVKADLVLLNGTVYTVNEKTDWDRHPQEAIAISGKEIAYVGNDSGATDYIGPGTRIVDLEGKMVLPGFIESHVHPNGAGLLLAGASLISATTADGYQKLVKDYASRNPNATVIRGFGWNYPAFGTNGPTKDLLDSVIPDRPVFLIALDGHSAWVNSKALEMAGVTSKTPDLAGGVIERDSSKNPSGALREPAAFNMVLSKLPQLSDEELSAGIARIVDAISGYGVTTLHDSGVTREKVLQIYSDLDEEGKLKSRVWGEQVMDPSLGTKQIPALVSERGNYSSSMVQMKTANLFIDGVVEGHTAYLLEPYIDRPGFRSSPIWKPEVFNETISALDSAGFQIEVHAIGDAAVRMALDAYQKAQEANGRRDSRHKIAHVVLVSAQDIPRFKALGVIPVPSPNWFYYDSTFETNNLAYLGSQRAEHMMPMKSLIDSGAVVGIGTDFPACGDYPTLDPLDEIKTGITRLPLPEDSNITRSYWPNERVDLKTMIECATINGAYACFMENQTGSLEVGKSADLVVIDKDLFKMPPEEINKARVLTTILEGREVFGAFNENEEVILDAEDIAELSAVYGVFFKDMAKEDIDMASGLIAQLGGIEAIYRNYTAIMS